MTSTYYHYTTDEGAKDIEKSKVILQSTDEVHDALCGIGVYLTKMTPDKGRKIISKEIFGRNGPSKADSLTKVIKLTVPNSKVQDCSRTGRDIHLFLDELKIDNYDYEVLDVKKP